MVSGIYICHWPDRESEFSRCELLLHRTYHNGAPGPDHVVAAFSSHYRKLPAHQKRPFAHVDGISYVSVWGGHDIVLLAVTCYNANAMSVVALLHQFHQIVAHYFSHSSFHDEDPQTARVLAVDRESIIDNYALMYELLDECVDFGQAQVTDYSILKEYIKMELVGGGAGACDGSGSDSDDEPSRKAARASATGRSRKAADIKSTHNRAVRTDIVNHRAEDHINSAILRTQVSAVSWRPKGIFYAKNEIYIDIDERCEFLYDLATQQVKTNHIRGVCKVRSYLSGMPMCKLGLNEKNISRVDYNGEDEEVDDDAGLEGNQLTEAPEEREEDEKGAGPAKRFKVPITNVQFHSCIQLSKIYKENLIFFTPPDGEFQLLSYNVDQQRRKNKPPMLLVDPVYRILKAERKLQIMCHLTTQFRKKLHCHGVVVRLPISSSLFAIDSADEDNFRFKCEMGEVRFQVDTSEILWAINDLPGSKKLTRMMAEVSLKKTTHLTESALDALFSSAGSEKRTDELAPDTGISELDKYYGVGGVSVSSFSQIQQKAAAQSHEVTLSFKIPMFTYSGLRVTYLRVDEETMKYTCFPWVRYMTSADDKQKEHTSGKVRFKMGRQNYQIS